MSTERKFWQGCHVKPDGTILLAFHVYLRQDHMMRLFAESEADAWEKVVSKKPDAHVIKVVPAPPITQLEAD